MPAPIIRVEVIGEGKADTGPLGDPARAEEEAPTTGVVPVFLHKLCGEPATLRVVRRRVAFLGPGTFQRKVSFAKVQAFNNGSDAVAFVIDTEGDHPQRKTAELAAGRGARYPDFPMAIGVAHPCIEAWLLCDPTAIKRALKLPTAPTLPPDPEGLPAPRTNRDHNPKTELARCGNEGRELPSRSTTEIARSIADLAIVEAACPRGFGPFAAEVRTRILPLFHETTAGE